LQLEFLCDHFFLLSAFLVLKLLPLLFEVFLLLLLLFANLLFHFLQLVVEVFIVDLELSHLFTISFFHCCVPIISSIRVYHRVHIEVILIVTNQNSVSMLELVGLFETLSVYLDMKLSKIFGVR